MSNNSYPNHLNGPPMKKQKLIGPKYLEDNTPIRTIELTQFPDNVCEKYLEGFFAREEPIEDVRIVQLENKKVAYVTFVDPADTAKLLWDRDESQYFPQSRFKIEMASAANQPRIDPDAKSLLDLNDDCLLHIMSFMKLNDIINLGKTCTGLDAVSKISTKKYSHFSCYGAFDPNIKFDDFANIFKSIGETITSIEFESLEGDQLDVLAAHAPNVTKLKLGDTSLPASSFKKNKKFFSGLTELTLRNSLVYSTSMKFMVSGNKLQSLILEYCKNVNANFLNSSNRKHLKIFKMIDCPESYHFDDSLVYKWDKNLDTFAFDKCCSLVKCLELPPEKLAQLKNVELDFSCVHQQTALRLEKFSNVERLKITRSHTEQIPANVNVLIAELNRMESLESFNIDSIQINNDTIRSLGLSKKLKSLVITNGENTIGKQMYKHFPMHLSNLEKLTISLVRDDAVPAEEFEKMIIGLTKLKYFSYNFMTWELLNNILKTRMNGELKYTTLTIGINKTLFSQVKEKADFKIRSKWLITLAQTEEFIY